MRKTIYSPEEFKIWSFRTKILAFYLLETKDRSLTVLRRN